jgi:hypothetical protein
MPTNNFPNIGYITYGRDHNFYQSETVTATTFGGGSVDGYQPDMIITFPTYGIMFTNETTGQVVEYSFNGTTVHGVLDGTSAPISTTRVVMFNNRVVSLIWFRVKAGSSSAVVTVTAWGTR